MKRTINPNIWPFIWRLIFFFAAVIAVCLMLYSCNPVKQARKDAAKAAQQRLDLAKLCAEMFPVVPSVKTVPGAIDTAGLLNWYYGQHDYEPAPMPETGIYTPDMPPNASPCPERHIPRQVNKDSLIAALKRYIKPDHTYETKPDSALTEALKGDLKKARDSLAPQVKKVTDLTLQLAETKGKASTRLWMFIAVLGINIGMLVAYFKGKSIAAAVKRILPMVLFLILAGSASAQKVDTIIDAGIYRSYYSYEVKGPLFVTYMLYKGGGSCPRTGMTFKDVGLPAEATAKDYRTSGYDEGHMANAKDFARDCSAEEKTFRFYNCLPQDPKLNRGIWKVYETLIRNESQADSLLIMCGGEFKNCTYIGQDVGVPRFCYKVVRRVRDDKIIHILWFPNDDSGTVEELKDVAELVKRLTYKTGDQ